MQQIDYCARQIKMSRSLPIESTLPMLLKSRYIQYLSPSVKSHVLNVFLVIFNYSQFCPSHPNISKRVRCLPMKLISCKCFYFGHLWGSLKPVLHCNYQDRFFKTILNSIDIMYTVFWGRANILAWIIQNCNKLKILNSVQFHIAITINVWLACCLPCHFKGQICSVSLSY